MLEYVAGGVERDVGLGKLVALTRLSQAQFFQALRRFTGSTPVRHMLDLRMRHAGTLLLAGRGIGEVAQVKGYGTGERALGCEARSRLLEDGDRGMEA